MNLERLRLFAFIFVAGTSVFGENALDLPSVAEKTRPSVFLITTADRIGYPVASGTGFLASKDGYLVTNHYFIRKAASAIAKGENGVTFDVEGILLAILN